MSKIIDKLWNGRKVAKEVDVKWGGKTEFGALYEAESINGSQGYYTGRLDGNNPIGFSEFSAPGKWHTLTREEKNDLNGVLISDNFRAGDVKIIYFI